MFFSFIHSIPHMHSPIVSCDFGSKAASVMCGSSNPRDASDFPLACFMFLFFLAPCALRQVILARRLFVGGLFERGGLSSLDTLSVPVALNGHVVVYVSAASHSGFPYQDNTVVLFILHIHIHRERERKQSRNSSRSHTLNRPSWPWHHHCV